MAPIQRTSGLQPHEIAILVSLAGELGEPMFTEGLKRDMEERGFTPQATGIAVMSLMKRDYVARKKIDLDYREGSATVLELTQMGTDWLIHNQSTLVLRSEDRRLNGRYKKQDSSFNEGDIPF